MGNRIGDSCQRRHDGDFAHSSRPNRMARGWHLDYNSFDLRQIEAGWHSIIEQPDITQGASIVVNIFLVERPTDALRRATLHLTLDVAWMERLAGVLRDSRAQYLDFSGVGVDLDVNAGARERRPDSPCIDGRSPSYWTTGARQAAGDLLDRHWFDAFALRTENAILEDDFLGLLLPDFGCALLELADHVLRSLKNRHPGGYSGTATSGHVGVTDRIGICHQRSHVRSLKTEDFRDNHCLRCARTADIDRTDHEAGGAIGMNIDHCRGLQPDVEPEARGYPAAAVRPFKLGLVMRAVLDCLDGLEEADTLECRSRRLGRAFLDPVHQPELARIDAAFLGEFVDDRFGSHRRVTCSGSPISRRP